MNGTDPIAPQIDGSGGPWLSLTDLARAKGVTKQTISEKVARLERDGELRTRRGSGAAKLVDVAQYDRLVGETSDMARVQAASTARALRSEQSSEAAPPQSGAACEAAATVPPPPAVVPESFSEAQKRKTQYEAAIKALDFGERSRQLVATDDVKTVIERMIEPQLAAIEALVLRAEEIAAVAVRDGVAGVRLVLKDAVFKLKATVAASWRNLEALGKERDGDGVNVDLELPEEEPQ